jgi:hypothetical protein
MEMEEWTIDHITYSIERIPDEFQATDRLWHLIKLNPRDDAGYEQVLQETFYLYYHKKGCVYKTHHHSIKR